MQILGLGLFVFVVYYGFAGQRTGATVSAFDMHAMVVVLGGSLSAILVMSNAQTTLRTFSCLRELIPGLGTLRKANEALEAERKQLAQLWLDGNRAQAVNLAEASEFPAIQRMLQLVLSRAPAEGVSSAFTELEHAELSRWQPAVGNWELLAKLAPSFGMVGTITGMIQLFKSMGDAGTDLGASLSLALQPSTASPSVPASRAPLATSFVGSWTSVWVSWSAASRPSVSSRHGPGERREETLLYQRRGLAALLR